jgi:hypothetical protein
MMSVLFVKLQPFSGRADITLSKSFGAVCSVQDSQIRDGLTAPARDVCPQRKGVW